MASRTDGGAGIGGPGGPPFGGSDPPGDASG